MARNETDARKRWALDRIAELRAQMKGIDDEIRRHQDFIRLLEQSDAAVRGRGGKPKPSLRLTKKSPLVAYLKSALRDSGRDGLLVEQITNRVTELGYRPKGKTPARIMVSTELARRSKNPDSAIAKISVGRYALADQAQLALVESTGR